jgi:ATP/maltotriose-dependent transcriptional regulator MalT
LERVGDDAQLALALETAALQTWGLGRAAEAAVLAERGLQHAQRAGDDHRARRCVRAICSTLLWGPAPVSEALEYLKHLSAKHRAMLTPENAPFVIAAVLGAYSGRFAEARQALTEARLRALELGDYQRAFAQLAQLLGSTELLAGNPAQAELALREGYDRLTEIGEQNWRATNATLLADALMRQDCDGDASTMLAVADEIAQHDDYDAQVRMRAVRAQILARRGELAQADRLAREAVMMVARTDDIVLHGDALLAFADVLRRSGATEEAEAALRRALELFERKENIVQAEQTRARLAQLETSSPVLGNSTAP